MSDSEGLSSPVSRRAREFVHYLQTVKEFPYATLLEAGTDGETDFVLIDVEPELAQRRVVEIRDHEPIRIEFDAHDADAPRAFAVREDFPLGLVHTNFGGRDGRCWLCLWEEPWAEARTRLDPEALLQRLRIWLSRTASGENHATGQPLEPLIQTTSNTLILPATTEALQQPLAVSGVSGPGLATVIRLAATGNEARALNIFEIKTPPIVHRAFAKMPRTLADLEAIAADLGSAFLDPLRAWLKEDARHKSEPVMLLLQVPMRASADGPVEQMEIRAFTTMANAGEVGVAMGVLLAGAEGEPPRLRLAPVDAKPETVRLAPWRVTRRLDRRAARALAGIESAGDKHVLAVGAGAIGSNVVDAAARSGLATWTIVDDDVSLPHNIVRQAQNDWQVGTGKAASLADLVNARLSEPDIATALALNVVNPDEQADALHSEIKRADLVLDLTASPSALRALSIATDVKRIASLFFGPDGNDLVLLAEPDDRAVTIDEIEAQYFWACAIAPQLAGHLDIGRLDFVRYANACQDLTRPLPPWKVLALSAIGARQVESLLTTQAGTAAAMWRLREESGEVVRFDIPMSPVKRAAFGAWRTTMSAWAYDQISMQREAALPLETGGVLLGTVDLEQRSVHITGSVPAPKDSEHSPVYFVRGAEGLREQIGKLRAKTAGVLTYLGEWHSHPAAAKTQPSKEDEKLYAHLEAVLGPLARPYCMAICGDAGLWLRMGVSRQSHGEILWER